MGRQLTEDVEEFRAEGDACFALDPARSTLLLTISESMRGGSVTGPARFGLWREVGGERGGDGTPLRLRGRGYGGAVTAAVSGATREAGAEQVLLYTDLANPTSNAVYRRLGYRPTVDSCALTFT